MDTEPIPVKAADLRRTDVVFCSERDRFAVVSQLTAIPGAAEVEVTFLDKDGEARRRYRADQEVLLRRRGINAQRVIERLCVPLGEKACAWRSERRGDHTFHAGFVPLGDGNEFVAALGAWERGGHIRLLPDGGEFPYSFSLADDLCLAMIDYCEGDIGVRVFDGLEAYVSASGQLQPGRFEHSAFLGELALSGELKPVADVAALAEAARAEGSEAIVVPTGQGPEAARAGGSAVYEVSRLGELAALACGELEPLAPGPDELEPAWLPRACPDCQRRAHLLVALAPHLERNCSTRSRALRELLGLPSRTLAETVAPKEAAGILAEVEGLGEGALAERLAASGCWALCRCNEAFPASLREAPDAPWALFGRGDPALLRDLDPAAAVAVVGARRATSYGREVARELGRELAYAGLVVISGMAFGVDGCAHRGALEAGRTIAVLATGPDVPYPSAHRALCEQICERGAVVSEMPPGTVAWRWSFPARNRIVAALPATTIVVEAAERSGSLITAEMARQMGRELCAVPGPVTSEASALPNRLLIEGADDEAARWRAEKIAKLAGDPAWHAVWDHFARILPAQLQKSPSQSVMRLEAPYNKIQTLLGDERLNTVLHHPVKVTFEGVIRRREMLLIAGRVFDHPDVAALLKFYMQIVHRAILGQQDLPEEERARVQAIGDDAGNLFTPTIARMMENDRSAGLDLALGWQHGGQVTPELSEALDSLCNSRVYLRSGEKDALWAVNRLNPAYEARHSGDLEGLKRTRVEVNQLTALDLKHGVAVWQAGEKLSSSFTVKTIPWQRDEQRLAELEDQMRADGGYDPEVIAPPRELTGRGENEDLDDVGGEGESARAGEEGTEPDAPVTGDSTPSPEAGADPSSEPRRSQEPEPRPAPPVTDGGPARQPRRGRRQAEVAPLGSPTDKPLSAGYREVEQLRDQAASITWEKPKSEPPELRHKAINAEQRAILEALYELRVLSAGQIQREFLVSAGERQVRRELSLLVRQRMLRRAELGLRKARGRGKRFYVLESEGFVLLRDATDHPASGNWRAPELQSSQHVVHDLARNAWLWAFRSLAPRQLAGWRGPRLGKVEVPLLKQGRAPARPLGPADLGENAPVDFGGEEFANLVPDLTLELILKRPSDETVETDLLVEIEWGNNDETVRRKAIAYDGFLTGWWRAHPRYKDLGRPPILFFVVPDARRAARFVELLDETLTSYLLGPAQTQTREQRRQEVTPQPKKLYLGRRNVFVAVARDLHQRTLRAWRVPAELPAERIRAARNAKERRGAGKPVPRPFMLIDPRDLVDPAR